jgi:hypothetical protein
MVVSCMDANVKPVQCKDQHASCNPGSWTICLLPDHNRGLRTSSVPIFGVTNSDWPLHFHQRGHPSHQSIQPARTWIVRATGGFTNHTHDSKTILPARARHRLFFRQRPRGTAQIYPKHTTVQMTRHTTDYITRHRDKPFFLYLAHAAPCDPLQGRDPHHMKSPSETCRQWV